MGWHENNLIKVKVPYVKLGILTLNLKMAGYELEKGQLSVVLNLYSKTGNIGNQEICPLKHKTYIYTIYHQ